jgi:hypothetical protein
VSDIRSKSLHIFILTGGAASLVNFRGPLIKAFLAAGYRVTAGAGDSDPSTARIPNAWGVPLETLPLARAGMNPIADVQSLVAILGAFRSVHIPNHPPTLRSLVRTLGSHATSASATTI